jgi:LPS export ABC transporter permease LptG
MTILFRYLARDFLRNWLLTLSALVVLIIIAALFGNIETAFSSWESFLGFYQKTVQSLPGLVEILLPMTVLLATVMTFSAFSRTSELVAMQTSGLGRFHLMAPLFAVLLMVSSLAYLNQNYLYSYLHREQTANARYAVHQWRGLGNAIFYLDRIDLKEQTASRVHVFVWRDSPFQLSQIGFAATGRRGEEQRWLFSDAIERESGPTGWTLHHSATKEFLPQDFPDVFKPAELDAHHMPLLDLYQEIKQRERQGQPVDVWWLEGYQKVAAVLAPFVMVLIGTPLSQFHFRRAKVAAELVITLLTGLVFMVGTQILYILGKGGFVAPLPAALGVNAVFLALALGLLRLSR